MHRNQLALSGIPSALILCLTVGIAACQSRPQQSSQPAAGGDMKIVDNPGGGQFAYGSLTGEGTKVDAVVYMLRKVHDHFGDKPQVGKFFQSRDGNSLATFFTLNAKNMGGQPISGLLIVTMPGKSSPQVAVLYDYANRFEQTEPSLLKALSAERGGTARPIGASSEAENPPRAQGGGGGNRGGVPERLQMATGGDRSAVVGLPAGWRLTGVAGGQLTAEGPHGEMAGLGLLYQGIVDPRNGGGQGMAGGGFSGRPQLVASLTADLFPAFVSITNQVRRNMGQSQGTFNLISERQLSPDGGPVAPVEAKFSVDLHDGLGARTGTARIGAIHVAGLPTWAMTVSTSNLPERYAEQEAATMTAVINSYSQDRRVIAQESAGDMGRIHQAGVIADIHAKAANDRFTASKQGFEGHMQDLNQRSGDFDQHMGNIDWSSKITQDYILDRSVVRDTEYDAHATVGNKFADALVKGNPDRFEIVPNQELIRGIDY